MSRATNSLIAGAVRSHRFIFIASTAILAVGTSRVAVDAAEWRSWLLIAGGAMLMYVSDLCQGIEEAGRELARTTGKPLPKARADVFRSEAPKGTFAALAIGFLLVILGFIGAALGDASDHDHRSSHRAGATDTPRPTHMG